MINFSAKKLLEQYSDRPKVDQYLTEVQQTNLKFNLFSRNSNRRDLELLIAESLIPVDQGWISKESGSLLDIGSGWGIPVIPILLSNINIKATMLERSQKKADFLLLMLNRLGLIADVVNHDLHQFQPRQDYSMITLRGVAVNEKLLHKLRQVSKPGCSLIYFGSGFPADLMGYSQSLEYKIDTLPVRHIIKFSIF